jgi:hypothetical protein
MSGAGDYAFKRITDLERELMKLKDRDTRIVTALEKRVARLEAIVAAHKLEEFRVVKSEISHTHGGQGT